MKELYDYLEIVRIVDINKLNMDINGRITNIEFLPGRDKVCIDSTKEFKITSKIKEKEGVTYLEYEIKTAAELSKNVISAINKRKVIVAFTDGKNIFWMGNKDFPATINLIPNLNNCEVIIQCNSLFPVF